MTPGRGSTLRLGRSTLRFPCPPCYGCSCVCSARPQPPPDSGAPRRAGARHFPERRLPGPSEPSQRVNEWKRERKGQPRGLRGAPSPRAGSGPPRRPSAAPAPGERPALPALTPRVPRSIGAAAAGLQAAMPGRRGPPPEVTGSPGRRGAGHREPLPQARPPSTARRPRAAPPLQVCASRGWLHPPALLCPETLPGSSAMSADLPWSQGVPGAPSRANPFLLYTAGSWLLN